jgi:hypothetical protein
MRSSSFIHKERKEFSDVNKENAHFCWRKKRSVDPEGSLDVCGFFARILNFGLKVVFIPARYKVFLGCTLCVRSARSEFV